MILGEKLRRFSEIGRSNMDGQLHRWYNSGCKHQYKLTIYSNDSKAMHLVVLVGVLYKGNKISTVLVLKGGNSRLNKFQNKIERDRNNENPCPSITHHSTFNSSYRSICFTGNGEIDYENDSIFEVNISSDEERNKNNQALVPHTLHKNKKIKTAEKPNSVLFEYKTT